MGTVEGGFLFNAKGMVVFELPGPRLLLVMNADMLSVRPGTRGTDTGKFLAVIEISPDSLTIGIIAEYAIKPLLEVRVPAEVFFDFNQLDNWHLDIGGIPPRMPAASPSARLWSPNCRPAAGRAVVNGSTVTRSSRSPSAA